MPSTWGYTANELPAAFSPGGQDWMKWRLEQVGRHNVRVWLSADDDLWYLEVGEANVSRNQLLFDVQPADAQLTSNIAALNVPPMSTTMVTIGGPVGKAIKVRFVGVGYVSETGFTIPGNSNYEFQLGACPAGQRIVTPQMFEFYAEDGSCSPVAVLVTFT